MVIGVFPNIYAVHSFLRTLFSTKTPETERMSHVACRAFTWNPDTGELISKYEAGQMTKFQLEYRFPDHSSSEDGYCITVGTTADRSGDYVWTMYLNAKGVMFQHDWYHQKV